MSQRSEKEREKHEKMKKELNKQHKNKTRSTTNVFTIDVLKQNVEPKEEEEKNETNNTEWKRQHIIRVRRVLWEWKSCFANLSHHTLSSIVCIGCKSFETIKSRWSTASLNGNYGLSNSKRESERDRERGFNTIQTICVCRLDQSIGVYCSN